ncbi:putative 28S ribosomal protein S16, mitochondrial [Thelohanellus kitauei]|uniref:Small ribosomal subunit protein bS16m n=1 Tax=Thelohanellus kitauei TaxID=669202 RepID=A0A0C2IX12_THEKT|nr:putative 28S ribosomal protein S16, mitochondrial [Thelohanellus kitauei]
MRSSIIGRSNVIIRLAAKGCNRRPFYHIVVIDRQKKRNAVPLDQVGSFDPIPNYYNEKLVSFNIDKIKRWLGSGACITRTVSILFGLAGIIEPSNKIIHKALKNRSQTVVQTEGEALQPPA